MTSLKNPKDMTLNELKIYLELKKSNIKLETLKLGKKINYYKIGYKFAKKINLAEKLKDLINFIKKEKEI